MGWFKKATHSISSGLTKAIDKGVDWGKNITNSSIKSITDLTKGDITGSIANIGNIATYGSMDFTGRGQGIVNVNAKKTLALMTGAGLGASGTGSVIKKGKSGLVGQLRKGKGVAGGGSYSETVKNPLGGSSGKTGK